MVVQRVGLPSRYLRQLRQYSETPGTTAYQLREGWLYVDSVFPIQLGSWDIRSYVGLLREESLLTSIRNRLANINAHEFTVLSLEPHKKDGGVFVRFQYKSDRDDQGNTLKQLEELFKEEASREGGMPTWTGFRWGGLTGGGIWLVRGSPWREDMNRFAFPILRVSFEGPDIQEQLLYQLFRPYGRIQELSLPMPVPAGSLRSSTVMFTRLRSAAIARNVVHGLDVATGSSIAPNQMTRLRISYQPPIRAHVVRDWMAGHPKILLPIIVFLLGTLTYTFLDREFKIFDPIRAFMVKAKMLNWFDYREYKLYKWFRLNALYQTTSEFNAFSSELPHPDTTSSLSSSSRSTHRREEDAWKEREDAENAVKAYLTDYPSTVALVHGPQGSGKSRLLQSVLKDFDRTVLYIDCRELQRADSDARFVVALAKQTGYWPIFSFLYSVNNLIDLVSFGLIGQKAGLSSSLTENLTKLLSVITSALASVSSDHRRAIQAQIRQSELERMAKEQEARRRKAVRRGTWHDGRIDCVAGNGVMSELGIGDEGFGEVDEGVVEENSTGWSGKEGQQEGLKNNLGKKQRNAKDDQAISSLPIVVIKNYALVKGGSGASSGKEQLLTALANWASSLTENQVAHVIVISDNRENARRLARALPSKPVNSIILSDADSASALSFVRQKLRDADINLEYSQRGIELVERLGGRASDLESLIHKIRNGQSLEAAVEDIINRGVSEIRKNAFGDDTEDAKSLAWTREQAWTVLRALANKSEVPYYDTLVEFPFKGDEAPLKSMEHADMIAIGTVNGRPSTIRPGKPVYKYVFERLVKDPIFQATQDIGYNEKLISSAESTIKACETELGTLKEIRESERQSSTWRNYISTIFGHEMASDARMRYLFDKMGAAEAKVEALERRNAELKRSLGKGG